jgi:hypothetical protein
MPSLNQFAYVQGTNDYVWGSGGSIPNIPITGAPADTNFARWAMLNDGTTFRLYFFKGSSRDTLYQFGFDGSSYAYGYNSIPVLTLTNIPADADMGSFAMLWDGNDYRLYVKRLGFPDTLYQAAYVPGSTNYEFGFTTVRLTAFMPCNWAAIQTCYRVRIMRGQPPTSMPSTPYQYLTL